MAIADTFQPTATAEALTERLFGATIATMDLFSVYLGDRLGYYRALADSEAMTSTELAAQTDTAERYTREWLEHQAATGIIEVENPKADATDRRFRLPAGYETVLVDPDSLMVMTPLAQVIAGCVKPLEQLVDAYRSGAGVPFENYGSDMAEGQAGTTRPQFKRLLAQEWIPAMPDVLARLQSATPARVADIGMGLGLSSIALAEAFPNIRVDGFDLDAASVSAARANAAAANVADRVSFQYRDAAEADHAGQYDFALAIECIHGMSSPVQVLQAMKRLVGDSGSVLIVDEKVADKFTPNADEVDRFMYGFSILHCLPVGMVEQPSAGTGTVMRSETLHRYAEQAGFKRVDVLPVEHDFFRFYRLTA